MIRAQLLPSSVTNTIPSSAVAPIAAGSEKMWYIFKVPLPFWATVYTQISVMPIFYVSEPLSPPLSLFGRGRGWGGEGNKGGYKAKDVYKR